MRTLFPSSFGLAFILLIVQTYLIIYLTIVLFRKLKLLKKPFGGMDNPESLSAAIILLGVLIISFSDAPGIFQTAKSYADRNTSSGESLLLFFVRSFIVILFFIVLFVILNFLNIRFLFRGHFRDPALGISLMLCAITFGLTGICWYACKEVIDNITPRFINFR